MSTRRTRARAAAMIANVLEKDDFTTSADEVKNTNETAVEEKKEACGEKDDAPTGSTTAANESKRDFNEILKERKLFDNSTSGFRPFADIWSLNSQELKTVENRVLHLETGNLYSKSTELEMLKMKTAKLLYQQRKRYKMVEAIKNEGAASNLDLGENKKTDGRLKESTQKAEAFKCKQECTTDVEMVVPLNI